MRNLESRVIALNKRVDKINPTNQSGWDKRVAISPNDVWAIGYYESLDVGDTVPLMLHWDGAQWNEVERDWGVAPDFLTAVTAVSGTDVWAAGYNYTDGIFFIHYSDPCASPDGAKAKP